MQGENNGFACVLTVEYEWSSYTYIFQRRAPVAMDQSHWKMFLLTDRDPCDVFYSSPRQRQKREMGNED